MISLAPASSPVHPEPIACSCQDVSCRTCQDSAAESLGIQLEVRATQTPSCAVMVLADALAAGYAQGIRGIAAAPPETLDGLAFSAFDYGVQEGLRDHAARQIEALNAANDEAADVELSARFDWEAEDEARQADREEWEADYRDWCDAIEADREPGRDWHEDEARRAVGSR